MSSVQALQEFILSFGGHPDTIMCSEVALYFQKMLENKRLVLGSFNGHVRAFCTFFLCRSMWEVEAFHERPLWTVPSDCENGNICYIDKLVSYEWKLSTRRSVQRAILGEHPGIVAAVWYRPSQCGHPDREYIFHIRHPQQARRLQEAGYS